MSSSYTHASQSQMSDVYVVCLFQGVQGLPGLPGPRGKPGLQVCFFVSFLGMDCIDNIICALLLKSAEP